MDRSFRLFVPGQVTGEKRSNTLLDSWKKSIVDDQGEPLSGTSRIKKFGLARDLALWISEDLLPFSFVEGTGLRRFFLRKGIVKHERDIPVRTTVSRGALEDAYETVKGIVKQTLPKDSKYHVSTDIWTDRHRHLPYIAVVLHCLDASFNLLCVPLKTDHFAGPHTGRAILDEIHRTLKDFDLKKELMFAAVSDSASNMVSSFKDYTHIRCADHRMHRALTADFYRTQPGIKVLELLTRLMRIYRHLIYKKSMIRDLAKARAHENYLDTLRAADEMENVRRPLSLWHLSMIPRAR